MTFLIAHVAGIPVEEALPFLVPVFGLGLTGIVAMTRDRLRRKPRHLVRGREQGSSRQRD
ncbi:MAG: hypothetical protein ACOYD4_01725 [Solirubrobacterales bacterium]